MTGCRRGSVAVAVALGLGLTGCSTDASVPAPAEQQRRETAAQLARAAEAQGICYGWRLDGTGAGAPVSRGSNLGDNTAVESDQRCPRWVEVRASVTYVDESSDSEDSATVDVRTSPDLDVGPMIARNLERFGLDSQAFIDDPALAIARAALTLPLLTAEAGAAAPAPVPTATATAAPRALDDAGNDFWRDRWVFVLAAAGMLVFAGVSVVVGLVQRRRQRAPAPPR